MADSDGGHGQPWDERAQQDVVGLQIALPGDIRSKRGKKKRSQQYTTAALPEPPGQNYVPGCRVSERNFLQTQTLSGL